MERELAEDRTGELDRAAARERPSEDVRLLGGERSFLFRVSLIGFVCGLVLAFLIPVRYTSTTELMPPENQSTSTLAMAAAAMTGRAGGLGQIAGDLLGVKSSCDLFVGILYLNSYTNGGNLIGSWIGRDGQGAQAWSNYCFTPRTRAQLNFRHEKVRQQFVPAGGALTDAGVWADYGPTESLGLSTSVQYERWLFPMVKPGPQRDMSTSIGIQIQPQKIFRPFQVDTTATPQATGARP